VIAQPQLVAAVARALEGLVVGAATGHGIQATRYNGVGSPPASVFCGPLSELLRLARWCDKRSAKSGGEASAQEVVACAIVRQVRADSEVVLRLVPLVSEFVTDGQSRLSSRALGPLHAHALAALRRRVGVAVPPVVDWALSVPHKCPCAECKRALDFFKHPTLATLQMNGPSAIHKGHLIQLSRLPRRPAAARSPRSPRPFSRARGRARTAACRSSRTDRARRP